MKCILCEQRKGKRFCPAKDVTICAQCCGEKRILEIDCPESCEFLKIGRDNDARQETLRHFRPSDPVKMEKYQRVFSLFEDPLIRLEILIASERRSSRALEDRHVAEALDCVLDTLRTEEKGVIYEKRSNDLQADALRRQMVHLVQSLRYPEANGQQAPAQERLRLRDAVEVLEVLREIVASHMEAGPSSLSFVDFLARYMPRPSRVESPGSSLIIPGR